MRSAVVRYGKKRFPLLFYQVCENPYTKVQMAAILNHLNCNSMCVGKEENFKIIGSSHTDFTLCIKESLLIHKNKPKLTISDRSMPHYLFE